MVREKVEKEMEKREAGREKGKTDLRFMI